MVKFKCTMKLLLPKEQFGAPGSHSDVLVHMRCTGPDKSNPISHAYVAVAFKVLFPSKPAVEDINPFSGGERSPQSMGTQQNIYTLYSMPQTITLV